jgi:DNA-binding response OmpR family regulator
MACCGIGIFLGSRTCSIFQTPRAVHMKRRILLVDDDLPVLLTLKAVLELHGFEVETATSAADAVAHLESATYHMVISDLRMETEDAGVEVLRAARRQSYDPATALLTAYPPEYISKKYWSPGNGAEAPHSMLIKPLGTNDLLRQIEALLIRHADEQQLRHKLPSQAQVRRRSAG